MTAPQFLKTDAGDELVVLSRRDYDALMARAGDEAAEDAMAHRILQETSAELQATQELALPQSVWEEIERGDRSALTILRRHYGYTQTRLAALSGVPQGAISEIENGARSFSVETLRSLSRALHVPADMLIDGPRQAHASPP